MPEAQYVTLAPGAVFGTIEDPVIMDDIAGTWGYGATGTSPLSSSVTTFTPTGRVVAIRAFANLSDMTFNINGGATIKVAQYSGWEHFPRGVLTTPTFNYVGGAGNLDIFVELAT